MAQSLDLAGLPVSTFEDKAAIFFHGEAADVAYLLVDGKVSIMIPNQSGELVPVSDVKPGEIFGEMALLTGGMRTAFAIADGACTCVAINQAALARELSKADPFIRFWINYMTGRLIDTSKRAQR
jgi:CRP-like cAMP-binding protein